LSAEVVNSFFDNFEKSAAGIEPCNIYNYDETNLRDNPGAQKAIFRKGVKYAEQVRDHSKTAISIMFCGSAAGELLPPYEVYKSQNHYEAWRTGGPPGARYTSSPSGWFDMCIGEDWFKKLFLPHVRRQPGRKLLIGDNLASHISMEVIRLCKENDIMFVCLPANSTDKMQPLDVGIFGPMKSAWRKQLLSYAEKDPAAQLLQKTEFPRMLKELVQSLKPMEHLPKAFEKCGLCPINREKVLDRLPSIVQSEEIARHIDSALLKKLEVRRFGEASKKSPGERKLLQDSPTQRRRTARRRRRRRRRTTRRRRTRRTRRRRTMWRSRSRRAWMWRMWRRRGLMNCLTWMSLALPPAAKAAATMLLLFMKASGSWRRSVATRRTWAEATPASAIW